VVDVVALEELEVTGGGMAKGLLLAIIDRFGRAAEFLAAARADFDKNEDIFATADEIDLTARRGVVAGEDAITVTAQERGGDPLAIGADLNG